MSTQKAELKNSKEVKEVKTLEITPTAKPTEEAKKADAKILIEKFRPEPILSAETRIERVKQFQELSKRFNLLKEKDNDLKMFIAGDDKTNTKITFQNTQGFKFEIQNTNVIAILCKGASEELSILLKESENEVLTFEI
jgi:hypothetical protein